MAVSDRTVREMVFDSGYDWPNLGPITDLIGWLEKQRESVEEQYRDLVEIDIAVGDNYGSACLEISIYYDRPELPNETQEHLAKEAAERKRIESIDRARYAELKRKYG